jgi:threonine synthase
MGILRDALILAAVAVLSGLALLLAATLLTVCPSLVQSADTGAPAGKGKYATDSLRTDAIRLLAETEGIFTEPAGGTTLAATIDLIERGEHRLNPFD